MKTKIHSIASLLYSAVFLRKNLKEYLEAKTSDNHFQTPLHIAAIKGSTAIAEYLISHLHVNKKVLDYKNRTPLALAA